MSAYDLTFQETFELGVVACRWNEEVDPTWEAPIPRYLDPEQFIVSVTRERMIADPDGTLVPLIPGVHDHNLIVHINERAGGNFVVEFVRDTEGEWIEPESGWTLNHRRILGGWTEVSL